MSFQPIQIILVIVAGVFAGTALLPMKWAKGWQFANIWLIYSVVAYLLSPWLIALVTVPNLAQVYSSAGAQACILTALSGLGWGLAVVLNGIGVAMIGLSLASAILMGSSIALGSLLPLFLTDPRQLQTRTGLAIVILGLVMLSGVLLCARAGQLREPRAAASGQGAAVTRGILICFLAGCLSTLFNVALTYGQVIARQAVAQGASVPNSTNAIWALAVSAGSLPSILLCITSLSRERQWSLYPTSFNRNAGFCMLMAFMWITGTVIYGAASSLLGKLGTAIGWPIYMSGIILTSSFWGWVTGEWRGVRGAPVRLMLGGIGVQVLAIVALSRI